MQKFYVVGIGPGSPEQLTPQAREALAQADIIAGYGTYVKLVQPLFPEKEYLQTGMTGEVKRCQLALAQAQAGRTVAMISSGDAGVYGMAGLVLQLAAEICPEGGNRILCAGRSARQAWRSRRLCWRPAVWT